MAPCGGEMDGEPTGVVTTYRVGSTIEVKWQEGVAHPGHFRIAVARDRSELEDAAVETTNGDGVTGVSLSAEIMSPPAYPVLLDGLFPRTVVFEPQAEPFSVQVELPQYTCEKCTLQVVQFMANHVPGYFYHHCADIRLVSADANVPLGASIPVPVMGGPAATSPGAASSADSDSGGGCSLVTGRAASSLPPGAVLFLGLLTGALRRRRKF
jgi:MYXO-CTERM domain-containing protein